MKMDVIKYILTKENEDQHDEIVILGCDDTSGGHKVFDDPE